MELSMPKKNDQLTSMEKEEGEKSMEVDYIVSDEVGYDSAQTEKLGIGRVTRKLLTWGVETRGIYPVPLEQRVDKQIHKIFFVWFSMNFNVLSLSTGTTGPLIFGLSLRNSCLLILFFNVLCCIPPAYLSTWGPKLGLRQMCQARYTFGYYGVIVPSIFNLVTMCGFMILNCILGGQTLAAVSNGNLSWTVGIVIISILSLLVSFSGYRVIGWYERVSWFPVLLVFLIALGVGGKNLTNPPPSEPATAGSVLSFASVIAGFVLTYSPLASDYTTYMVPEVKSWRVFFWSYFGFLLPIVSIQCLGAAIGATIPVVPAWNDAYVDQSIGDLFVTILKPVGGFGKFLTVLLSLSVTANIAPTMYSFGLSFQVFVPICSFLPRYVFSVLATAIVIPLSIVGAHRFYTTLTNFLGLIGYWASCFIAVIVVEHLVFRRLARNILSKTGTSTATVDEDKEVQPSRSTHSAYSLNPFENYDISIWNTPSELPSGIPAIAASLLSFALVIPCMDQVWFVGPIARTTGDIGFEVALLLTAVLYVPLRYSEIRWRGKL